MLIDDMLNSFLEFIELKLGVDAKTIIVPHYGASASTPFYSN
jgi:hypothetical protein